MRSVFTLLGSVGMAMAAAGQVTQPTPADSAAKPSGLSLPTKLQPHADVVSLIVPLAWQDGRWALDTGVWATEAALPGDLQAQRRKDRAGPRRGQVINPNTDEQPIPLSAFDELQNNLGEFGGGSSMWGDGLREKRYNGRTGQGVITHQEDGSRLELELAQKAGDGRRTLAVQFSGPRLTLTIMDAEGNLAHLAQQADGKVRVTVVDGAVVASKTAANLLDLYVEDRELIERRLIPAMAAWGLRPPLTANSRAVLRALALAVTPLSDSLKAEANGWLDQLDSPDPAARDEASARLLGAFALVRPMIDARLAEADVPLETSARLRAVLDKGRAHLEADDLVRRLGLMDDPVALQAALAEADAEQKVALEARISALSAQKP